MMNLHQLLLIIFLILLIDAVAVGNISDDGGFVTRGVCWSINSNPTILDNYSNEGNGIGTFTSNLTD